MKMYCNWNHVLKTEPLPIPQGKFNQADEERIITASLMMDFDDIHSCYGTKEMHTKHEIENHFKSMLVSPPKLRLQKLNPEVKIPFTTEEDYWILTYVSKEWGQPIESVLKQYKSKFYPIHTKKEILERIEQIHNNTPEQNDEIITKFAHQILNEKLVAEACIEKSQKKINPMNEQNVCMKLIEDKPPFTQDDEINELQNLFPMITNGVFKKMNVIAKLVSEKYSIDMPRSRLTIGFSHGFFETDVDLRLISDTECPHISKKQAIISLLPDCHFYIENIGNAVFRVNGVIIPPKKACLLPDLALLDFCDQLFMFVPNTKIVDKIRAAYKNSKAIKKKAPKEKAPLPQPPKPKVVGMVLPNGQHINNPIIIN